jgi:nickel-dependent lactate racemase
VRVELKYGDGWLPVELDAGDVRVMEPAELPALPDERRAFAVAVRHPIESAPLSDIVKRGERLAIAIADSTRPLPSARLLPWLFEELAELRPEDVVILSGTGSHRANTREELARLVGDDLLSRCRVVNHDARDPEQAVEVGVSRDGHRVKLNRHWVEADRRIALGFIEPHFMAGFSGGYKGVFPALADIDSIVHYHRASVIADPKSTWGLFDGNPTQALIRECGAMVPLDFLINVTLDRHYAITGCFAGHPISAHEAGAEVVKRAAMVACEEPFPIVVTTNAGAPLDQNLYQAVKGMCAAAQVIEKGGLIVTAARCNDGFPEHGNFKRLLFEHASPQSILDTVLRPGFSLFDQWEAQKLAMVAVRARIGLFSELDAASVRRAHLEPVTDVAERVALELARIGKSARVLVLPEGPMTVPYLA